MSLALVYPGLYLQHSLAPACAVTSWASLVPLSCGLGPALLEDKLALLDLGLETGGRVATNGRGRGPQAMDDMLYGSSADNSNMGKI